MQFINVGILMLLVFATSLGQVYVRHEHRVQYLEFSRSVVERDEINIEWNQLLTESSTWSFPHRVEKDATKELSMRPPKAGDMVSIDELGVFQEELDNSLSLNSDNKVQGGEQ